MATTYEGYALIIGVNAYRGLSRQAQKDGSDTLNGAINDVRVWWDVARAAGIPARNIRVLTTRRIEPGELETGANGVTLGLATRQEILDGVEWLAKRSRENASTLMLAFAGRGGFIPGEGLVIGPSDVSGANLLNAVKLSELRGLLAAHAPTQEVVAFFDCSFGGQGDAGVANGAARDRSLKDLDLPESEDLTLLRPMDRVALPVPPGVSACELPTRHGWHGPLSREAMAVLDAWDHPTRGGDGEAERHAPGAEALDGLLERLLEAGLRDLSPPALVGGGGAHAAPSQGSAAPGDGSELSGDILGFRVIDLMGIQPGVGEVVVGRVLIDTSVAGTHSETWFLNTQGPLDNGLKFIITYNGASPQPGLTGPGVVSWAVNYDDSQWVSAAGKVIPATDLAANLRSYVRAGAPQSTMNKWITLELPGVAAPGKLTWWSAYASTAGLIFTPGSKVGDFIQYDVLTAPRSLTANGRLLVETMA